MKRKRTLNETWLLCLRMWRAIVNYPDLNDCNISTLKQRWLYANGFTEIDVLHDCFFCDYAIDPDLNREDCTGCPGCLVDPLFDCCNGEYYYRYMPIEFRKKLLELNRIRKNR